MDFDRSGGGEMMGISGEKDFMANRIFNSSSSVTSVCHPEDLPNVVYVYNLIPKLSPLTPHYCMPKVYLSINNSQNPRNYRNFG